MRCRINSGVVFLFLLLPRINFASVRNVTVAAAAAIPLVALEYLSIEGFVVLLA